MADDEVLPGGRPLCWGQMGRSQRDNSMGWTQEEDYSPR